MDNQQGPTVCIAQGALINVVSQPGWEGSLGESGYVCLYSRLPLLAARNYHSIVNWLRAPAQALQSSLTLGGPMDCSPPGSTIHGILQARTLEWVAMPSSRGTSGTRDPNSVYRIAGGFLTAEPLGKPSWRHCDIK